MCRTIFSRTTMASSIRIPIASERPSRDMVLSVKPNAHTAMNDASTETGSANPVITVDRHEFRNTNTTRIVSSAPMISASMTLRTESWTRTPESFTMSSFNHAGSVFWISATLARSFKSLRLQDLHYLTYTNARRLQRLRPQLNLHLPLHATDDLHLGDPGNSAQLARDIRIGEARELRR